MSRRKSLGEILWPDDRVSRRLAVEWAESIVEQALELVWRGFDQVAAKELKDHPDLVAGDPEQLEREMTQWHSLELTKVWAQTTNGYASFTPIHEPHELETRKGGEAMPPSNDIGFIHCDNKRWKLPVEAKLLPSGKALSEYVKDVTVKYVGGIAAPLVGECGMVGYLLRGTSEEVFDGLSTALGQKLLAVDYFVERAHRTTMHARRTAPRLRVHHMVMSCTAMEEPPCRGEPVARRSGETERSPSRGVETAEIATRTPNRAIGTATRKQRARRTRK